MVKPFRIYGTRLSAFLHVVPSRGIASSEGKLNGYCRKVVSHTLYNGNIISKASMLSLIRCQCSLNTVQSTPQPSVMQSIYSLSEEELREFLKSHAQQEFRAKQIRDWIYNKGVTDFDEMKNIPVSLREHLKQFFQFGSVTIAKELVSKDGTIKRAYKLQDGQIIESVLMPYRDGRLTACISSQAGCAMRCSFCATGQMGFSRQLTSAEIFEQVQHFYNLAKIDNRRVSNVVFMGMGEPLANYDNVFAAVRRMNSELGIGARHITISTVGLVPRIYDLAKEDIQVNLAISLHQATDEQRSALMPINKRFPIDTLIEACKFYIKETNRRVSFEWALIRGQTDSPETAHQLGNLLSGLLCHVNLIPLNPTNGFKGEPSDQLQCQQFIDILAKYKITATMRIRKGLDITAGCGQLSADIVKRRRLTAMASQTNSTDA